MTQIIVTWELWGHLGMWRNLKFGTVDTVNLHNTIESGTYRKINNNVSNIDILNRTISLLTDNDIEIILVNMPAIDTLINVQKDAYYETIKIFERLESENVRFINLHDPWSTRYDLFFDPIHLNPKGQSIITDELLECISYNQL